MCTGNKIIFNFFAVIALIAGLSSNALAGRDVTEFTSSKGLRMKFLKDDGLGFTHAELIIYYTDSVEDPVISHLAIANMFNQEIKRSGNSVLNILKKLGNDFSIESRPDYVKIKVNFLSKRISTFIDFIKSVFEYRVFAPEDIARSIKFYWKIFFQESDWKRKLVTQIAYSRMFPGHYLGNTLVRSSSFKNLNYYQVIAHYHKTYRLANAFLFVKGDVNPFYTFGLIERKFGSYRVKDDVKPKQGKFKVNPNQRVLLLDIPNSEFPVIYRFTTIPSLVKSTYLAHLIINHVLFGYPNGNIFRNSIFVGIRNIRIDTQVINHREISVICNTISRIHERDIERFLLMVTSEKRKLRITKVSRKDYLNAIKYLDGRLRVNTEKYTNDVNLEIDKTLFGNQDNPLYAYANDYRNLTQLVSLQSMNRTLTMTTPDNVIAHPYNGDLIIIAGDGQRILRYLRLTKPEVIRLSNEN